MDYPQAEEDAVHEAFEQALAKLDVEDREPDRWEEDCLGRALTAMGFGNYKLAAVEVTKAATPPNKRSPGSMAHVNSTPQKFTKDRLRRILEAMRTRTNDRAAKARARSP